MRIPMVPSVRLRTLREEAGQVAIGFLLFTFVIFMFFAFAFDAGLWYFDHRFAQNQVDAAALAGAMELPNTTNATDAAVATLQSNGVGAPNDSGNLCPSWTGAVQFSASQPSGVTDRVRVCQRRSTGLVFSMLSNVPGVKVSALAMAQRREEPVRYAIMVMDPDNCQAFNVTGSSRVNVLDTTGTNQGGATLTLSSSTCPSGALSVSNNARLTAVSHDVNGSYPSCSNGCITGTINQGVTFEDPWAALTAPSLGECKPGSHSYNGGPPVTLTPGRYCDGISVGAGARVTFEPGVYVLAPSSPTSQPADLSISPNQNGFAMGSDVLFYLTCNPSPCGGTKTAGHVSIGGGGGLINLDSNSNESFPYEPNSTKDILVWVDRTSNPGTSSPEVNITGGSSSVLSGHIYAFSSDVQVAGGSAQQPADLNVSIMANTLSFAGNSYINMLWDLVTAPKIERVALIE